MPAVDVATSTTETLTRMLRRLPASLWNTSGDDSTLQRDLYRAFASQMAIWLENREIARRMTLLLEAEGVDLDVLLEDYGLRRYLQRPDAYARQIGMQILWYPQGTLYSVARLADLLFDFPHVTLRTGRSQQHVFVAATHPVTTPYSYWGLVSAEGLWYAVTINATVPVISQAPPPGLDVSPGPHTLTWFTVQDELAATWYVSIVHDTLRLATTAPAGYGTTEPFAVLDGHGQHWFLQARSTDQVLTTTLDTGLVGFGAWRLMSRTGVLWYLSMQGGVPTITTTAPAGSVDQTPGGTPLDWVTVVDEASQQPWYLFIEHDTLAVTPTVPGGVGTAVLAQLLDASGQRWVLTVDAARAVLVATDVNPTSADLILAAPEAPFQALQLVDSAAVPWWLCMDSGTLFLTLTLPLGAADVTPPGGPYAWWRAYDRAGTLWYVWPSTAGVLELGTTSPGGSGTAQPQVLGDTHGVLWHVGVDPTPTVVMSDAPPVDYGGLATAICMTDEAGGRWFWRVDSQVLEWSPVLWPDTLDQSPWGELGWLQVVSTAGATRYIFPTPLGDALAAAGPPAHSPWGWQHPVTLLDAAGTPWTFTVLPDDRIGVLPGVPSDLPLPTTALPLPEAMEAFGHVQAAGSALTVLIV